jgi:hypothetical protein
MQRSSFDLEDTMQSLLEAAPEPVGVRVPDEHMRHLARMNAADNYEQMAAEEDRYRREQEQRLRLLSRRVSDAPRAFTRRRSAGPARVHRQRESRRRPVRAAAGSSRRNRSVDRSDDSEPPAAACPGCGERFPPASHRQRYCTKACANAARQRRWYDRHVAVEAPEPPARPEPLRGSLVKAAELRDHANAASARRLQLWLELPEADQDRARQLLVELQVLDDEIARTWDAIRLAEAVAA